DRGKRDLAWPPVSTFERLRTARTTPALTEAGCPAEARNSRCAPRSLRAPPRRPFAARPARIECRSCARALFVGQQARETTLFGIEIEWADDRFVLLGTP